MSENNNNSYVDHHSDISYAIFAPGCPGANNGLRVKDWFREILCPCGREYGWRYGFFIAILERMEAVTCAILSDLLQ